MTNVIDTEGSGEPEHIFKTNMDVARRDLRIAHAETQRTIRVDSRNMEALTRIVVFQQLEMQKMAARLAALENLTIGD